jgi:hypothetical protein
MLEHPMQLTAVLLAIGLFVAEPVTVGSDLHATHAFPLPC